MGKPRPIFAPGFKFQVVMDVLAGRKRRAEALREHQINESTLDGWVQKLQERGPSIFASEEHDTSAELARIAEMERFPTYGYRRVTAQLRRDGCLGVVNAKRVRRVMRENDLLIRVKRRVKTTDSEHSYGRYPNLVQDQEIVRPDQVWCADITYIQLQREFIYLAIVLDIFTRSLRGWELGRTLSSELALGALERALATHRPEIHHSDQGIQYAAHGYVERLQALDTRISMATKGQPTENPYAERAIRTIKAVP